MSASDNYRLPLDKSFEELLTGFISISDQIKSLQRSLANHRQDFDQITDKSSNLGEGNDNQARY